MLPKATDSKSSVSDFYVFMYPHKSQKKKGKK